MRVGISTFGCEHGKSGLGTYLYSVIQHLTSNDQYNFVLFGNEPDRFTYFNDNHLEYISVNSFDNIILDRFFHKYSINKFYKKYNFDMVIYAGGARFLPDSITLPSIVIVNEVVSASIKNNKIFLGEKKIKKLFNSCAAIIASSEYIKKDLVKIGVNSSLIKVIYSGINQAIFFPAALEHIESDSQIVNIKPFAIKKKYIVYGSKMQNNQKKHLELIKAFNSFKKRTGSALRLVIAGAEGPYSDEVHKAAYISEYSSDIFITGYFSPENFSKLYRNAEACIFPAVNEGVALPVLEAMASGIPVACSSSGVLPEITGNLACYFDSSKIEEISGAIDKVVNDTEWREKVIKSGIEWTKNFTWEKTVENILNLLDELNTEEESLN